MTSIPLKRCLSCAVEKPATSEFFHVHKSSRFGVMSHCRECAAKPRTIPGVYIRCSRCSEEKLASTDNFGFDPSVKIGFKTWCRDCAAKHTKARFAAKEMPPHPSETDGAKVCNKCGVQKTLNHFTRSKSGTQGVVGHCKKCSTAIVRAGQIARQALLPPKPKPQDDWLPGHKVCTICRIELPFSAFGYARLGLFKRESKCRECRKVEQKAWKQANPEMVAAQGHRRRAVKRAAGGKFTGKDVKRQLESQGNLCYWCRKPLILTGEGKYHIDHLIPLHRGGSNGPENIVCACPFCNDSKGTKLPHEWTDRLL